MSKQQRFGLVALAVVVAAVAFVIARPGDDGEPSPSASTAPARIDTAAGAETTAQTAPAESESPEPEVHRLRVRGGEPVGGVREIEVEKGERVRLTVSSDTPQHVHVHGYDVLADAAPGSPARLSFEAGIEGVFEVELEGPHTLIAELRVEP